VLCAIWTLSIASMGSHSSEWRGQSPSPPASNNGAGEQTPVVLSVLPSDMHVNPEGHAGPVPNLLQSWTLRPVQEDSQLLIAPPPRSVPQQT
jgi:hypothetical protein